MLSVSEALQRILGSIGPLATEHVAIGEADGRVLAEDIVSGRALPPYDNSAMDGFAVRAAELPATLPVTATIAAGARPDAELSPGQVARIMTGAPVPRGADAVVMREDVDDRGDRAAFAEPARPGQHIRRAGEDVEVGATVLRAGTRLGAGEIGLLAALGVARVPVGRRPRVAILSTGDELVDVGETPAPGQIVNSNAYALAAQVREAGGDALMAGIAPDERTELARAIGEACAHADVLVSSGGVSVGDFDHVKDAFADASVTMDFWKVAMKPGKPLAFGVTAAGIPVFGLPGNPVSSMVVFELFTRPALLTLQGAREIARPIAPAQLGAEYRKQSGRAHFLRVRLTREAGVLRAHAHARQGSGMLTSMVDVDGLAMIPADTESVAVGEPVDVMLLRPR